MKDLKHLEMYKVEGNPRENEQNSDEKHYWFEFPTTEFDSVGSNEKPVILTNVSPNEDKLGVLSVSVEGNTIRRAVTTKEMYILKDFFCEKEESLVWYYNVDLDKMGQNITKVIYKMDLTDIMQILLLDEKGIIFEDLSRLLEKAYEKKVQKNKSFIYVRGNLNGQQYIHVHTEEPFPWVYLKAIAKREFRKGSVTVLFNEITRKYPNEYIIFKMDEFQIL